MVCRLFSILFLILASCLLTGCLTTSEVKPRSGVNEAKACQRTLENNPSAIPGYRIQACTNTGIWVVEQLSPEGFPVARFDFVNGDYAGPETGGSPVPVDSLGDETIQAYHSLHKTLNQNLKDTL